LIEVGGWEVVAGRDVASFGLGCVDSMEAFGALDGRYQLPAEFISTIPL